MSMNINRSRSRLLTGAGTIVLATMLTTAAHADPATTTVDDPTSADIATVGHVTSTSGQTTGSSIEAQVSSVFGGIDGLVDDGTSTGTSNTVSANTIQANAIANRFTGDVDLGLINSTLDPDADDIVIITPLAHGAAALSVQQTAGANVSSLASSNELTIDRPGFESGSAIAEQNSIAATSVANQANQSIAGIVPNGYVSDAGGTSSIDFPAGNPVFQAEGTVVASTIQQAVETGARALSAGNQITLDLTADGANVVASAPQLDSNSIAASTTVNSAQTTIDLQSDEAPLFTGSAVLSNVQTNSAGFFTGAIAETVSSSIVANIYGNDLADVNTLTGSLSVAGNSIASSATGNDATGAGTAGNRILIGDAMSFEGSGAVFPGSTAAYDDGDLAQSATADIVINSSQSNVASGSSSQRATTASFEVLAQVQSLDEGTIDVAGNRVTATVTGNDASSAIASGDDAASFTGSVALANQQTNLGFEQSALVAGGVIGAETGTDGGVTQDSGITVASNVSSASAYGNNSSQSVALDSNGLDIGTGEVLLTAGTTPDGNARAAGGATLLNLQSGYSTTVSATQSGTRVGLDADSRGVAPGDTISGSTLAVTGNTQEAVALGSSASNAMSLASNDVGSGAGVVSGQIMNTGSSVSAGLGAAEAGVVASTHVDGSQLETSGNLQRAIAYGGSVSNGLTVDSNNLTLAPSAGSGSLVVAFASNPLAFSDNIQPVVTAAFGVLSDQSTQADVTASATGSRIGVTVEGDVASSTVANEGNGYVAAAYGNDAANAAMLSLGNVDAGGFAAIGAIVNTQASGDDTSRIVATATGGNVFNTDIEDDVSGSSVSTSGNAIQAVAAGNRATGNQLTADGNNIDSSDILLSGSGMNAETLGATSFLEANASFTVQNAQSADGVISASQLDDAVNPTTAAAVLTTIGTLAADTGDVTGSTVSSDGNRSTASATGNSAVSGVSLSGNQLATTTGVQNFQSSNADLSALIGMEGTAGSPGFTTTASGSGAGEMEVVGDTLNISGPSVLVDFAGYSFSSAEAAYLNSLSGVAGAVVGGNTVSLSGSVDTTVFTGFSFGSGAGGSGTGDETISLTGFSQPGTAGLPNAGGVTIAVNGDIAGSMLSVDGNSTAGSVIGNNGTNTLNVAGTSIASGSGVPTARAGVLDPGVIGDVTLGAEADNALSNLQTVGTSAIESEVFSTFALDAVEGVAIDETTLSVSGNDQSSTAVANTAVNRLTLAANDIASGSALSSSQSGDADVAASSTMEVFAPAAVSNSSVSMSDNANRSLAAMNDATNVASVSGANVSFVSGSGNAVLTNGVDGLLAEGDQVLANQQAATTSVNSFADTRLYNEDRVDGTGLGLRDSSLVIAGNSTSADGSANRALNSLTVAGSASQTASAGVSNLQSSSAGVTVSATSTVGTSLAGGNSATPAAATTGSSIAIEGNATTALARGNAATNVLNVSTGASYGTAADLVAGSSLASVGGSAVNAQAAVLNGQSNSAPVQATSTSVTYTAALNAGVGSSAVQASTVSVNGNRVATEAYGNSATNSLTMASLQTGTPTAAVGNYQTNAGFVSAQATSVTYGIQSGSGNVGGSSLGVTGNAITATAVGNSATTSITAGR